MMERQPRFAFFGFLLCALGGMDLDAEAQVLEFQNRAACAADSRLPSEAAYVLVDSFLAGKWLDSYRQAAGIPEDDPLIEDGLQSFRIGLTRRIWLIAEGLLAGAIPVLSPGEKPDALPEISGPSGEGGDSPLLSCRRILRFSSLHSEGALGAPDRTWLRSIADDLARISADERGCFEPMPAGTSRRFLLRLEVRTGGSRWWRRNGFSFWHSLRTHLIRDWAFSGGRFRDLALDQMLVFLPKGCRSIDPPACSRDAISLQEMRGLLNAGEEPDEMRRMLSAPEDSLLVKTPPQAPAGRVFPEEGEVVRWLEDIQTRWTRTRGRMKLRLLTAVSSLELVGRAFERESLFAGLVSLRGQQGGSEEDLKASRKKLRVLCSEAWFSIHPEIGRFRHRLNALLDRSELLEWSQVLGEERLRERIREALGFGDEVLRFCADSRAAGYWRPDDSLPNGIFAGWYRVSALNENPDSGMGTIYNQQILPRDALIRQERIETDGSLRSGVLCSDHADCARWMLRGLVELLLVCDWAGSLLRIRDSAPAPDLSNPWAIATACGIYDPQGAWKRAWTRLISDLASNALLGLTPVPAWISARRAESGVTGWMETPEGEYRAVRGRNRLELALGIDLGPIAGIPCLAWAGEQTPGAGLPPVYRLSGLRAQACSQSERHRVVFRSGELRSGDPLQRSACLVCVLSPISAAGLVSHSVPIPLLRLAAGVLVSAFQFTRNIQDPDDIPRRYRVDAKLVQEAFARDPSPDDRCVRRLLRGRACR